MTTLKGGNNPSCNIVDVQIVTHLVAMTDLGSATVEERIDDGGDQSGRIFSRPIDKEDARPNEIQSGLSCISFQGNTQSVLDRAVQAVRCVGGDARPAQTVAPIILGT